MTRIKYKLIQGLLVSSKCYSTKLDEDLVYAEINPRTFGCSIIATNGDRSGNRINLGIVTEPVYGSSLNDCKKKIKKLLSERGVIFDVEARNKLKKTQRT